MYQCLQHNHLICLTIILSSPTSPINKNAGLSTGFHNQKLFPRSLRWNPFHELSCLAVTPVPHLIVCQQIQNPTTWLCFHSYPEDSSYQLEPEFIWKWLSGESSFMHFTVKSAYSRTHGRSYEFLFSTLSWALVWPMGVSDCSGVERPLLVLSLHHYSSSIPKCPLIHLAILH